MQQWKLTSKAPRASDAPSGMRTDRHTASRAASPQLPAAINLSPSQTAALKESAATAPSPEETVPLLVTSLMNQRDRQGAARSSAWFCRNCVTQALRWSSAGELLEHRDFTWQRGSNTNCFNWNILKHIFSFLVRKSKPLILSDAFVQKTDDCFSCLPEVAQLHTRYTTTW